jgi:hypothetical protein
VVTRSGVTPVTILADSKNAFAAAMSRCSLNITSTSAEAEAVFRQALALAEEGGTPEPVVDRIRYDLDRATKASATVR